MPKTIIKHLLKIKALLLVVQIIITASILSFILPASYAEATQNTQINAHLGDSSSTLLPIYNNEPISIVNNQATNDRMPPIVAFADNSCGGKLSIVKYSSPVVTIDGALQYAYIGKCISDGTVHNIVLRNSYNTLYVAYIDNDNQIKLKQQRFGRSNWNDYAYPAQFLNKNPNHLDMVIDSNSIPIITYTSNPNGKDYQYINVLRYENDSYQQFAIGDKVVTRGQIRASLDSNNNLYIAYLDWNFCPGIIKLLAGSNNWVYLNSNFGDFFKKWVKDYPDAFDMVIKQRKNIKDGGDMLYFLMAQDSDVKGIQQMDAFTYNIAAKNPALTKSNINIKSSTNLFDGMRRPHLHVDGSGNVYVSFINNHRTCIDVHGDPFCVEKFTSKVIRFASNNETNYFSEDIPSGKTITAFVGVNQTSDPAYYPRFLGYQLVAAQNGYKMFPISQ